MSLPHDYAARLAALTDDQLAAELRHVASGAAREARGTRERDYWERRRRYLWAEWAKRERWNIALQQHDGWTAEFAAGWQVGRDRHELLPSPIAE